MHYKSCQICGIKSGRSKGEKRLFLAKFTLDEARCKQWVKVVGKEDLAYVPIEKLHSLKHVCVKHFKPTDLKNKKTLVPFAWVCDNRKNKIIDALTQRLSLLLIRNQCKIVNRSFAISEESTAEFMKKAEQQGIAK